MMGRSKKWSSEERERVAVAWTRATHDPVVGRNQSGETFDEKVYSLFSQKPPKDADLGTYSECSHPSVMTCFRNNISPDVMKFIGVLWMVKGVGLSSVTAEQLIRIAVAAYLLKRKVKRCQNLILHSIYSKRKILTTGRISKPGIY